jgi:hypothetical protein
VSEGKKRREWMNAEEDVTNGGRTPSAKDPGPETAIENFP